MRTLLCVVVCVAGCSKELSPLDRSNCTKQTRTDANADGEFERTTVEELDEGERLVEYAEDGLDGSHIRETYTYDANGCVVGSTSRTNQDGVEGANLTDGEGTCDANGDPLTYQIVQTLGAGTPFSLEFTTSSVWERTYGDNGLTASATSRWVLDGVEQEVVEHTYEYDDQDRVVRRTELEDGVGLTVTTEWFDADTEQSMTYTDDAGEVLYSFADQFDEYGRQFEREETGNGDPAVRTSQFSWVDKTWTPAGSVFLRDGVEVAALVHDCDEEDPWLSCIAEFDGSFDGDPAQDGVPDIVIETTWTCP